jgi:hypothetical protein
MAIANSLDHHACAFETVDQLGPSGAADRVAYYEQILAAARALGRQVR